MESAVLFTCSKAPNFIVKNTFKVTCFGSTEPSSGLFVRTDPYHVYGSVLTKRPNDGSVEPKHVALNVFLTINWMCLTKKSAIYIYSGTHGDDNL
jgi:hypothetical protein